VIVRSIIDLARNLDVRVVAEGVENRTIWNRLAMLGCDQAQGYFLGRPMSVARFDEWLTESSRLLAAMGSASN
jgi:diguanylate cyclase